MARKLKLWRWTRKNKLDVMVLADLADVVTWLKSRKYEVDPRMEADLAREAEVGKASKAQPELPFGKKKGI